MKNVSPTHQQTANNAVEGQQSDARQRDFVLLCATNEHDESLAEAVHALYYLPQNYKLVVLTDHAASQMDMSAIVDNTAIMDRIRFESNTGKLEQASPYSFADVVISNVATDTIAIETSGSQSVVVPAHHPEAFASAVMGIARAQA